MDSKSNRVAQILRKGLEDSSLAKARKKTRFKGSTTTVPMERVDVVGESGNSHAKWSGILPLVAQPNGVMVSFSRFAVIWLLDAALVEGSPDDVRKFHAENVKDSETERQ